MSKIAEMLKPFGYIVDHPMPDNSFLIRNLGKGTNPYPCIIISDTDGCGLPPDQGPFLIAYYTDDTEGKVVIEISHEKAADVLIPILAAFELNLPK